HGGFGVARRSRYSRAFSSTSFLGTATNRRSKSLNRPYSESFGGDSPLVLRLPMASLLRRAQPERLAGQPLVGEAASGHMAEYLMEAPTVVVAALVEPEHFLVHVGSKVERRNVYVGAAQHALEQGPEILDALRVDVAFDVHLRVVDDAVDVL